MSPSQALSLLVREYRARLVEGAFVLFYSRQYMVESKAMLLVHMLPVLSRHWICHSMFSVLLMRTASAAND